MLLGVPRTNEECEQSYRHRELTDSIICSFYGTMPLTYGHLPLFVGTHATVVHEKQAIRLEVNHDLRTHAERQKTEDG